jgi:hypothetical protein
MKNLTEAGARIVALYRDWGKSAEAERWKKILKPAAPAGPPVVQ